MMEQAMEQVNPGSRRQQPETYTSRRCLHKKSAPSWGEEELAGKGTSAEVEDAGE